MLWGRECTWHYLLTIPYITYLQYVWVIDIVRSRWLDIGLVLFFRVFMDRDEVEVHKLAKKSPAILTEQTWSIKDLLYGFRGNRAGSPERARWPLSPARVANHIARFGSSCPLAELDI